MKTKSLIQVLIGAKCLSDTLEDAAADSVQIANLYATNDEFKQFCDECIEIHDRLDKVFKESDNAGVCQNALGFYYIEIQQSNIADRYDELIRKYKI